EPKRSLHVVAAAPLLRLPARHASNVQHSSIGGHRMSSMNREPRVIVITGGTAGIGRAIARRFAREGNRIGLISRDQSALEETQRELEGLGAKVAMAATDVADADAVFDAAAE